MHDTTLLPLPVAYLRRARRGEVLLLASYCPFTLSGPYKEYGPVYVLAQASNETLDFRTFPAKPQRDYLGAQFVLRAYSAQERIVDARLSTPDCAQQDLQALFAADSVAFVLVRFAAYGCYACRIERSAPMTTIQ